MLQEKKTWCTQNITNIKPLYKNICFGRSYIIQFTWFQSSEKIEAGQISSTLLANFEDCNLWQVLFLSKANVDLCNTKVCSIYICNVGSELCSPLTVWFKPLWSHMCSFHNKQIQRIWSSEGIFKYLKTSWTYWK